MTQLPIITALFYDSSDLDSCLPTEVTYEESEQFLIRPPQEEPSSLYGLQEEPSSLYGLQEEPSALY